MRQDPKEIELKLALTPADFGALKAHRTFAELLNSPARVERLVSIYFDTEQRDLHKNNLTLRVRREGQDFIQTIKTAPAPGVSFEREQWEQPLADAQPDLTAITHTPLGNVFTAHVRTNLRPVFETRVELTYYDLADSTWRIEIAFDQGEIVAGNRAVPICEIELELKYGYRAALFELARMIVEIIPARLMMQAKADRGYELLEDKPESAVHAAPVELTQGMSSAQAFQRIASGCLGQLLANAPLMHARNPDALHQVRIAVRRLRTAISLFSEIVRDGQVEHIKSELRWLNGELSPARDLDTLMVEVIKPLYEQHPDHKGLRSLRYSLARQMVRNYRRAAAAIRSQRYCRLMVDAFAWIEIGEWITATDAHARSRRDGPVELYAAEQLARRSRKIKKKGRKLEKLDPGRRHKLRIQVKKTRYATEFFAGLFRERKARKRSSQLLGALKHMQSSLGGLNDVRTRSALCADLLAHGNGAARGDGRDRAFAAGLIAGNQEARHDTLLADAQKAHEHLAGIKPFWK
jgi:inorganic triphosphatase YgiF